MPIVAVGAQMYAMLVSLLMAGDLLVASAARHFPNQLMTPTSPGFVAALDALAEVPDQYEKVLILSSVEDAQNLLSYIPADIDTISYNLEGGMSPQSEMADPVGSAQAFAAVVHSSGRRMNFGPLRTTFDALQEQGRLPEVLGAVDGIVYQGQLLYESVGEREFIQTVKGKYNYVKANSDTRFQVQLWLGRQTPNEIVRAFNKLRFHMDVAAIGPANHSQVDDVLRGLIWR